MQCLINNKLAIQDNLKLSKEFTLVKFVKVYLPMYAFISKSIDTYLFTNKSCVLDVC